MLRLGVDAGCWTNRRGYGRFTRGIITALATREDVQLTLIADRPTARALTLPPRAQLLEAPATTAASEAASASGHRPWRDLLACSLTASRARFDVFFFPSVYTYFPLFSRTPQVVALHDAIPEQLPDLVFPNWRRRLFWALKVRWALRAARRVVTVSPFAATEVRQRLGVSARRLRVLSEAPDPVFFPRPPEQVRLTCQRYRLGCPYLLYVGGFSPHKDLRTLLRAFYRLLREQPTLHLALAGDFSGDRFYTEPLAVRALQDALGIAERVHWLGYVPDEDLAALYSGAVALVLPSLGEGFGLPVVEAAACGCPVVASDRSHAADVIAATRVFPAKDDVALAATLRPFLEPAVRQAVGAQAQQEASRFQWSAVAAAAMAVFREVSP
ncbi:MAG: glycosyl transferase family 1 [Dehalococcoidia bacterium]|nr:MAG: glycosyl transferase family 1 [Dehalococcoidia bacterium]